MRTRIVPSERVEHELRAQGHRVIVGLDEVGRGAWAGPLVVGAVILPPDRRILGLRDSKLLRPEQRERLTARIKEIAIAWAIGVVEVVELNDLGLADSLGLAARRAITGLSNTSPSDTRELTLLKCKLGSVSREPIIDYVLIDGKYPYRGVALPHQPIIGGDATVRVIATASVIAKVARDDMLRTLHESDPALHHFRFDLNKGYPSPLHQAALRSHGPSAHHRTNFAPIAQLLTPK